MLPHQIYTEFNEQDLKNILIESISNSMKAILPMFLKKINLAYTKVLPKAKFKISSRYTKIYYEILSENNKILKKYFPNAKSIKLDLFKEYN
jgi:hypothetical protein